MLDVSSSTIPRLRPGFVRDLTADMLVIPHHPHAILHVGDGRGTLVLRQQAVAAVRLPSSWAHLDTTILAVLPQPPREPALRVWQDHPGDDTRLPDIDQRARGSSPADRFLQSLDAGVALVAEIDVRATTRTRRSPR
ncbi:hypothetical protein HDA40_002110 [Hamadaea flava]|uniref:Uncharacterized protein n=1 Tax=Hamadaea flava TaxID=1742688 RepID=A0ABV8LJL8_9ACTN|nr:hypothetical protein [Hamadaea flava]MCP2323603.1 hypothetical protein [Hamadaea flava]